MSIPKRFPGSPGLRDVVGGPIVVFFCRMICLNSIARTYE